MSDPQRAKVLLEYSQKLKDQHADGDMEVLQDIWHSSLIKDLKEKKGLFKEDTDLALGLAGDGVAIFSKNSGYKSKRETNEAYWKWIKSILYILYGAQYMEWKSICTTFNS